MRMVILERTMQVGDSLECELVRGHAISQYVRDYAFVMGASAARLRGVFRGR